MMWVGKERQERGTDSGQRAVLLAVVGGRVLVAIVERTVGKILEFGCLVRIYIRSPQWAQSPVKI